MDAIRSKPLLRGVSHQIALAFAVPGAAGLIALSQGARATAVSAIYGASLTGLFGISALYHRPTWPPRAYVWLRRLDHSMIFVFIAASASTVMAPIPGSLGVLGRSLPWGAAAVGIARAALWPRAPRWVASSLYVAMGWMIVPFMGALHQAIGVSGLVQLLGGGLLYTTGAVVYALRRPDPAPHVFGYHEIFHLLVIAGAALHFALVARLVTTGALA
jgi:hemolysin III